MNLEARKIKFIQEFLKLQSEHAVSKLEKLLESEKGESTRTDLSPFDKEGLNERIAKSEMDFVNGLYKTSGELLKKYK